MALRFIMHHHHRCSASFYHASHHALHNPLRLTPPPISQPTVGTSTMQLTFHTTPTHLTTRTTTHFSYDLRSHKTDKIRTPSLNRPRNSSHASASTAPHIRLSSHPCQFQPPEACHTLILTSPCYFTHRLTNHFASHFQTQNPPLNAHPTGRSNSRTSCTNY